MIKEEIIRDRYGKCIGKLQYESNGDITVRDFCNGILGYYVKSRNATTDSFKRIIAKGNVVGLLFK